MKLSSVYKAFKNGRVVPALLWRLNNLGLTISLYFVFREQEVKTDSETPDQLLQTCVPGFLSKGDLDEVVQLNPEANQDRMLLRLDAGHLCFGIKKEGRLLAYMWCDLEEFNYPPCRHRLAPNEAYLYDAWVSTECRGLGMAPFMRYESYKAMGEYSRDQFLSYSDYYNGSAIRFKQKLKARKNALYIYFNLRDKIVYNWKLKDYSKENN